ncbi:MOSC domain-containing protein [soil metagenome]
MPLPYTREIEIVSLLSSPQHRYDGRPADGPRDAVVRELHDSIAIRAHLGVVGDRYFGQRAHVTASVTIMAIESIEHVQRSLGIRDPLDPADTRRNIITRGLPIDELRGQDFELGGVLFRAHRPANPCAWMDVTLAAGAFRALKGRGGMRCEPLSDGTLAVGGAVLRTAIPLDAPVPLF